MKKTTLALLTLLTAVSTTSMMNIAYADDETSDAASTPAADTVPATTDTVPATTDAMPATTDAMPATTDASVPATTDTSVPATTDTSVPAAAADSDS